MCAGAHLVAYTWSEQVGQIQSPGLPPGMTEAAGPTAAVSSGDASADCSAVLALTNLVLCSCSGVSDPTTSFSPTASSSFRFDISCFRGDKRNERFKPYLEGLLRGRGWMGVHVSIGFVQNGRGGVYARERCNPTLGRRCAKIPIPAPGSLPNWQTGRPQDGKPKKDHQKFYS